MTERDRITDGEREKKREGVGQSERERERERNLAIVQKGKGGLFRGVGKAKNLVKNLKKSTKITLCFFSFIYPFKNTMLPQNRI